MLILINSNARDLKFVQFFSSRYQKDNSRKPASMKFGKK